MLRLLLLDKEPLRLQDAVALGDCVAEPLSEPVEVHDLLAEVVQLGLGLQEPEAEELREPVLVALGLPDGLEEAVGLHDFVQDAEGEPEAEKLPVKLPERLALLLDVAEEAVKLGL